MCAIGIIIISMVIIMIIIIIIMIITRSNFHQPGPRQGWQARRQSRKSSFWNVYHYCEKFMVYKMENKLFSNLARKLVELGCLSNILYGHVTCDKFTSHEADETLFLDCMHM